MDKYEFNIKVEQIKKLVNRGDYATAMKIADTIDWHRVRNASLLSMIAQVYEKNEEYQFLSRLIEDKQQQISSLKSDLSRLSNEIQQLRDLKNEIEKKYMNY